jgi:hypothetical protein
MTSPGREETMTMSARKEPAVTVSPNREAPTQSLQHGTQELPASARLHEREPSNHQATESEVFAGDPRALLAGRILAAGALLVTALIHAKLAFQLGVVGGSPLGLGQLFLLNSLASATLAVALFSRSSRAWLFAVVLSGAGLLGILASVYFPIASVGPFPAINEPTWLLTKAVSALAELTVIVLWLIRRIAPASPLE